MYISTNCTISGKHTLRDYGLYVTNNIIFQPPAPQYNIVKVPFSDTRLDFTEASGGVHYGDAAGKMILKSKRPKEQWPALFSRFINDVHGKQHEIVCDNDPGFYHIARITVKNLERAHKIGTLECELIADPYKYELTDGSDKQLWDNVDFEQTIFREYGNLTAEVEPLYIKLIGLRKLQTLIVDVLPGSNTAKVAHQLPNGEWSSTTIMYRGENIYPHLFGEGEHLIRIIGGRPATHVTLHYRGGSL